MGQQEVMNLFTDGMQYTTAELAKKSRLSENAIRVNLNKLWKQDIVRCCKRPVVGYGYKLMTRFWWLKGTIDMPTDYGRYYDETRSDESDI